MKALGFIRKLFRSDDQTPAAPSSSVDHPVQTVGEPQPGALAAKTILLVDDDAVILLTTSLKLQATGYEVITAADGSEAISAMGRQRPDLVLLDIDFPPDVAHGGIQGWDGFQIMHWLRGLQNRANARFIIISGSEPGKLEKRSLAVGAVAFFQKPIDHAALLAVIDSELSGTVPTIRAKSSALET